MKVLSRLIVIGVVAVALYVVTLPSGVLMAPSAPGLGVTDFEFCIIDNNT